MSSAGWAPSRDSISRSRSTERTPQACCDEGRHGGLAAARQAHQDDGVRHRRPPPSSASNAARITSTGAGVPSHSSSERQAWPSRMPAPDAASAPAARASRTRRVGLGRYTRSRTARSRRSSSIGTRLSSEAVPTGVALISRSAPATASARCSSEPSERRKTVTRSAPTPASASCTARLTPPAPRMTAWPTPPRQSRSMASTVAGMSVLCPMSRSPSRTTVLTASAARATSETSSISAATAALCGTVTLAPPQPRWRRRATALGTSAGATSLVRYRCGRRRASKAAAIIAGDAE